MMEYQIVPTCKHGQVKPLKHRAQECCKKSDNIKRNEDDNLFILQPMLKLPKSTREVKNGDDETSLVVNAVRASNKCPDSNNFNHFTMSRKGLVKGVVSTNMSRSEDPWNSASPTLPSASKALSSNEKPRLLIIPCDCEGHAEYNRRISCDVDRSSKLCRDKIVRRASTGDALLKNNRQSLTVSESSRLLTLGPDEMLVIPQGKHQQHHHHPKSHQQQRSGQNSATTNKSESQRDNKLKAQSPGSVPRRKSFHDWYSMRQWYCPDEIQASSDMRQSERRNVISPDTLSRIIPEGDKEGSRTTSGAISVCTEGDMMSYNFNLPSRRLVSHKELKGCTLPYNDNIGLEETVSSDQARKGAKLKMSMSMEVKKKYEDSKQTPKQVWYRTIRSILAANHLYHQIKNKKSAKI